MLCYSQLGRAGTVLAIVCMFVSALFVLDGAATGSTEVPGTETPFSMEFRDADIKDVIRAMGQAAGMNIIISDSVSGKVTMSLKNVDLWAAFESILKTKGLTYVREANMIRVVSLAEVHDSDLETRVFTLGHVRSQDVLPVLDKVKSDRAKITVDPQLNAVVVRDLTLNLDRMGRLLRDLDVKTPQVLIEAKIVEVSTNYARELGVQWGGKYSGTSSHGTTVLTGGTTGATNSGSGTSGTASGTSTIPAVGNTTMYPLSGDIGMSGNAYAVNLPASVGAGSGGALGISFGKLGGGLSLDLQLSAMQTTGNGKILSSPKVMTANNKEAKISSGIEIPVRVVTATTVGASAEIKTINANLTLSTTPTIASNNRIALAIKVEKSEPDFSRQVDNIPTIITRNANTDLVVADGETVVLGGILITNESESESAVPFLSKIPVLGWLFKKKTSSNTSDELMIFITPSILKEQ
ncbi:MAG TPA: type IV pilus secretin PilQ [Nitrospirota bacterium]|nr:type IV pilus secretin PilQ [Nitrospirota bacterium]